MAMMSGGQVRMDGDDDGWTGIDRWQRQRADRYERMAMTMGDRYRQMATMTGGQVRMDRQAGGHTRVATRTVSTLVYSPPLILLFSHPPSLSLSPLCSPPLSLSCLLLSAACTLLPISLSVPV